MAEGKPRKRVMRILTAEQAEAGVTRVRGETTRERRQGRRQAEHARLARQLAAGPAHTVTPPATAPAAPSSRRAAAWADIDDTVRSMPPPPATQPTRNPELESMMDPANFTTGAEGDEPRGPAAATEPVPPIAEGDEEEEPENQDTILPKGGIPVQMQAPKLTPFQKVGKGIGFAQQHYPFPGAANGVFVLGFGLAAVAVWTPVIKPILDVAWHATPEAIAQGYVVSVQVARPSSGAISLVLFLLFLTFLATLSPNLAEVIFWLILGLWAVFLVMNPDKVQAVASWISQGNAGITAARPPAPPPVEHPPAQEATQPPRAGK